MVAGAGLLRKLETDGEASLARVEDASRSPIGDVRPGVREEAIAEDDHGGSSVIAPVLSWVDFASSDFEP